MSNVKPVVIVFDINEGIQQWFDDLADAVRDQSGGKVIITHVDAAMSDVMIAVADRVVSEDEAFAIWESDDGDDVTNRDVDPEACDAADLNDFGDEDGDDA